MSNPEADTNPERGFKLDIRSDLTRTVGLEPSEGLAGSENRAGPPRHMKGPETIGPSFPCAGAVSFGRNVVPEPAGEGGAGLGGLT